MSTTTRAVTVPAAFVLVAGMVAACGGSSGTGASGGGTSGGGTLAFIPGATGVGFYNSMKAGAKAEAEKLGYHFKYQGSPDFTATAQTPVVNSVCATHPKVLLIAPTDPVALRQPIQTCLNDGVKVVTVDTGLKDTGGLVSAVTSDNMQGGAAAADLVGKRLGGKGEVATMSLNPTTTTQAQRVKGFKQELARKYPGITVVANEYTGQPETTSETDAKAILTAHPGVKAFFGAAEPNAEGTAKAIKALGKKGTVINVGYDADPSEVTLLKSGDISALVIQKPAMEGRLGARYGDDAVHGRKSAVKASVKLTNLVVTTAQSGKAAYTRYYYAAG